MKYKNLSIKYREYDKRWHTRFTYNGKQYSVYGRTQKECLEKLKKALVTKPKELLQAPKQEILTFKKWVVSWFRLFKTENKLTTQIQQQNLIDKYLAPIKDIDLTKIDTEKLQGLIVKIDAPRQKEKVVTILKDIFARAYELQKIPFNPTLAIKIKKHKSEETKAFSISEQEEFEKIAYKYKSATILIQLYQGLRPGEALALTKQDFDFKRNVLYISKAYNQKGILSSPKTANSKREIPLFDKTLYMLKFYNFENEENIFNKSRDSAEDLFNKICNEANLKGFKQRSLRHTFGTRGAELGITTKVIQKWMGHTTVTTTLKYYTHINKEFEVKETNKFNILIDTKNDT